MPVIQPSRQNKPRFSATPEVPAPTYAKPGVLRSILTTVAQPPTNNEFESKFEPIAGDYKAHVDFLRIHKFPDHVTDRVIRDHETYYAKHGPLPIGRTRKEPKLPACMEDYDGVTNESNVADWIKFYRKSGFSEQFITNLCAVHNYKLGQLKANEEFIDSIMGKYSGKVAKKKVKSLRSRFKSSRTQLIKVDDCDSDKEE